MNRTGLWKSIRVVLRGRTTEVIQSIPDESLDFAYVDADHTLRGISVDLLRVWPKVRSAGFIGGDDFCPSAWQHSDFFEPTLVYPFALYFAEAMDVPIYALPHNQFLIQKEITGFTFVDKTGSYGDPTLRGALGAGKPNNASHWHRQLFAHIRRRPPLQSKGLSHPDNTG